MQADFPQCRWLLYVGALSLFVAVLLTGGGVLSNLRAPETATEQAPTGPALRSVGPLRPREAYDHDFPLPFHGDVCHGARVRTRSRGSSSPFLSR